MCGKSASFLNQFDYSKMLKLGLRTKDSQRIDIEWQKATTCEQIKNVAAQGITSIAILNTSSNGTDFEFNADGPVQRTFRCLPIINRQNSAPITWWLCDAALTGALLAIKKPKTGISIALAALAGIAIEWTSTAKKMAGISRAPAADADAPFIKCIQLLCDTGQSFAYLSKSSPAEALYTRALRRERRNQWSPTYRIYQALASGYRRLRG